VVQLTTGLDSAMWTTSTPPGSPLWHLRDPPGIAPYGRRPGTDRSHLLVRFVPGRDRPIIAFFPGVPSRIVRGRYGVVPDGERAWVHRRAALGEVSRTQVRCAKLGSSPRSAYRTLYLG
jgi:hypothetical protein